MFESGDRGRRLLVSFAAAAGEPDPGGVKSWLVSSRQPGGNLSDLLRRVQGDPGITVVRVTTLSNSSQIAVLKMSDETARRIRDEFKDRFRVELNRELKQY